MKTFGKNNPTVPGTDGAPNVRTEVLTPKGPPDTVAHDTITLPTCLAPLHCVSLNNITGYSAGGALAAVNRIW